MDVPTEKIDKSQSLTRLNHLTLTSNPSEKPSSGVFDKTARIILVGDSGVGKSCIILRYCQDLFKEKFPCTAGVELSMKPLNIDGEELKLQIWDTAGQERYRTVTKSFYKNANGVLLVFDLTHKETFYNLDEWIKMIEENAPNDICITIVGNKCDMKDKTVENQEIEEFMRRKKIRYFETSAKTNKNISEVFLDLAKRIKKKKFDNKNDDIEESFRISSSGEAQSPVLRYKQEEKKGCC